MKRILSMVMALCILSAAALGFSGCEVGANAGEADVQQPEVKAPEKEFRKAYFDFALKLFSDSAEKGSGYNTLISPLSVMEAMAMVANGARGDTLTEMEKVLGGGMSIGELAGYLRYFQSDAEKLSVANSVWIRNGFKVKDSFISSSTRDFGAGVYRAPFDRSTVDAVNDWVDKNTKGMIKQIVDEDNLAEAVMCLCNALAFEAKWEEEYGEDSILASEFTRENGAKEKVMLLCSREDRLIKVNKGVGFMKNYDGGEYSFAALLPEEGMALSEFIDSLDADKLAAALKKPGKAEIIAYIPEFKAEYEAELSGALGGMGIKRAFSGREADLSGITEEREIFIDSVLHKTFIEVSREGTKAAAVTAVIVDTTCAPTVQRDPVVIRLDRPFVYMIIDNETSLPVFIGAVDGIGE